MRTEESYNPTDFASVMGYLHRRFGAEVFGNAPRMYAIFRDLAPKLTPYGNIARQVAERGLLTELGQAARDGDSYQQARVMLKTRDFLENELLLGADRVAYFLTVFGTLYGVTPPDVAQPVPQNPQAAPQTQGSPQAVPQTSDSSPPAPRNPHSPPEPEILPVPEPQALPMSGRSGALTWSLDSAGLLTISGSGDMDNFTRQGYHQSGAPWCVNQSALTAVVIKNGVAGIGNEAFSYCANLKRVMIPDTVTRIGYMAFRGCSGLRNISIPSGVVAIERSVFEDCTGLTSVRIPRGVTHIQSHAFAECRNLTSVTIPNSVRHIGYFAFRGCANLKRVYVPVKAWVDPDAFNFDTDIIRW